MMLALEIFFWVIVGCLAVGALGIGVMVLLAKEMSDNASDNQPGPVGRALDRFMEWFSALLRHGKP